MNDLVLGGCSTTVLAHYLKALAIHRLVAEQKDPSCLSYWDTDGQFHLVTSLDFESLVSFFLDEYAPSAVITPWNGGSGFYPGDQLAGIQVIESSTSPRLRSYREGLSVARACLSQLGLTAKPEKENKFRLLRLLRARLPDDCLAWLDAAAVIAGDEARYPAILGSGGNDGRLDFANNFMQRIAELMFPSSKADAASIRPSLISALAGLPEKKVLVKVAIGQFAPANAGGTNMTAGLEGDSRVNRWDFVLGMEGALVFAGAACRRFDNEEAGRASFPFHFNPSASGFFSLAVADGESARAEIWLPKWPRPAAFSEIRQLFAEGRLDSSGEPARSGLDAARAVASLGADRGLHSFSRLSILRRNGLAYLASAQGEFHVRHIPNAALLQRIWRFFREVENALRKRELGGEAQVAAVRLVDAAFDACRTGQPLTDVLTAFGLLRRAAARSPKSPLVFPKQLSTEWLPASLDGSAEFAVAAAVHPWLFGKDEVPGILLAHPDPLVNIVALAKRRIRDGDPKQKGLPLLGADSVEAGHLRQLLAGGLGREKLTGLLWALHLVPAKVQEFAATSGSFVAPASYALLRAVTSPRFLGAQGGHPCPAGVTAILARLEAHDFRGACEIARQKLNAHGAVLLAPVEPVTAPGPFPQLAAALVLPLPAAVEQDVLNRVIGASQVLSARPKSIASQSISHGGEL